jgi:hypothetical protein
VEVNIVNEVAALQRLSVGQLRQRFAELFGKATHASNRTWLLKRIAWCMQALTEGDLSDRARRRVAELARNADLRLNPPPSKTTTTTPPPEPISIPTSVDHRLPPPGTILTRPYKGQLVQVQVLTDSFAYAGRSIPRSTPPKPSPAAIPTVSSFSATASTTTRRKHEPSPQESRGYTAAGTLRHLHTQVHRGRAATGVQLPGRPRRVGRSLHPQPDTHEGWTCLPDCYDDGGFTGGNMERPALRRLLADIQAGKIDCVLCYKVDRLSRSLLDFAKMMEALRQQRLDEEAATEALSGLLPAWGSCRPLSRGGWCACWCRGWITMGSRARPRSPSSPWV